MALEIILLLISRKVWDRIVSWILVFYLSHDIFPRLSLEDCSLVVLVLTHTLSPSDVILYQCDVSMLCRISA